MERDRRSKHAARDAQPIELELRGPLDHVADVPPVDQVAALEHRDAREVGEGRVDEVEQVAGARDARVRVEAGKNGVAIASRRQRVGKDGIAARVLEPVECDWRLREGGERAEDQRGYQVARSSEEHGRWVR